MIESPKGQNLLFPVIQEHQKPQDVTQNQKVFYANIGKEPYIVNSYMRSKGLSSFKLVRDQNESDVEFLKRKAIFMKEKELKSQYENMRR